jgi:hypothetical protein
MRVPKGDPALAEPHQTFGKHMNVMLTRRWDGVKFVLDFIGEQRPAAKGKNPADFVDVRFLKQLEAEGFFKKFSVKR